MVSRILEAAARAAGLPLSVTSRRRSARVRDHARRRPERTAERRTTLAPLVADQGEGRLSQQVSPVPALPAELRTGQGMGADDGHRLRLHLATALPRLHPRPRLPSDQGETLATGDVPTRHLRRLSAQQEARAAASVAREAPATHA